MKPDHQVLRGRDSFLVVFLVFLSCALTIHAMTRVGGRKSGIESRSQGASGSAMAELAASMPAGTWAQLATNNFQSGGIFVPPGSGSILEYMDKAAWNPVNRTLMILGMSHPSIPPTPCNEMLFLKFSELDNTWSRLPNPCPEPDTATTVSHGYEHVAMDPETGNFFHREYYSGNVMYFSQSSQSWIALPAYNAVGPSAGHYQVAGALECFPDRHSLIAVDGDWGVWEYSLSQLPKGSWKQIAKTNVGGPGKLAALLMGSYGNFATYSPAKHVLIFGGGSGSSAIYRMDPSGRITLMKNAPIPLGVTATITTVDPVSGEFLVWDSTVKAWEYDPIEDSWAETGISSPILPNSAFRGVFNTVAAPVSTYGVVMFVTYNFGKSSVYLYKHGRLPQVETQTQSVTTPGAPSVTPKPAEEERKPPAEVVQPGVAEGRTTKADALKATTAPTLQAGTAAPEDADYGARCRAPGVVRCVGFDTASDIAGGWGGNSGIMSGATKPALDSAVKASGGASLKFTIPAKAGADTSGSYFTNFSKDLSAQFGENSEFYVQWRQRFSPEFLSADYQGGGGWKQAIIGTGDQPQHPYASCTDLEVVVVDSYQRGFPRMYNSCSGSNSHGPYDPFEEHFRAYDFKLQNARPSPFCLYSQGQTNPHSYFPKKGNCFGYFANEWMTFQVHIKMGPRTKNEFSNSQVQLWMAREGQPSQLVIDWGPYALSAGEPTENQRYGKVWLLPYNTNKDSSVVYPVAYTWYDELIISRQRIADPK
jgi:hypothetical protein